MQTIRSFKDDDDMDYAEPVEAVMSKRKYLLNSLFDLEHFPKDTELTEDNDCYCRIDVCFFLVSPRPHIFHYLLLIGRVKCARRIGVNA